MRVQLGAEFPDFIETLRANEPPVSVRLNGAKLPRRVPFPSFEKVPWHPRAVYLPERPSFAHDPNWHGGRYYVQEASSMLIHAVIRALDFSEHSAESAFRALDLCAAPGGKTTLLLDAPLPSPTLVVANEVIKSRVSILRENLTRWGRANVAVTNHDPADFAPLAGWFDLVLVDAPCSGEGLFRRDPTAANEWSPAAADLCAARQARILDDALPLVRPGGYLIYSTCTYNPAENDARLAQILKTNEWELVHPDFPASWGLVRTEFGHQAYPHRVRGEGFYVAALQRTSGSVFRGKTPKRFPKLETVTKDLPNELTHWIPADRLRYFQAGSEHLFALPTTHLEDLKTLNRHLARCTFGLRAGQRKGRKFVPDHALALYHDLTGEVPTVEVERAAALDFLRKHPLPPAGERGWQLVRCEGLGLGWQKNLGNRTNNYLPTNWRLRK